MRTLIATKDTPYCYDNVMRAKGDEFKAVSVADEQILIAAGAARLKEEPTATETKQQLPEEAGEALPGSDSARRRRGRYSRRDIVAEQPK